MSIANDIIKKIRNKKIHFSLIDPDKQSPKVAGSLAKIAEYSGTTAIMIGGSTISFKFKKFKLYNKRTCERCTFY